MVTETEQVNMDNTINVTQPKPKELVSNKRKLKIIDIYTPVISTEKVELSIEFVDRNTKETLRKKLSHRLEGTCCSHGYVKPNSLTIINFSAGVVLNDYIQFTCTIEMFVCLPTEGMVIECQAKNITKAGIRAEVHKYNPSPLVIFIARDHHFQNAYFNNINENDIIHIRVIGQRYELNDKFISVIAEIIVPKDFKSDSVENLPKINIEE
uniref:S1 motif domain-containing protein n=1 Tax=viral metagenome TaxID=1070528 RepID=A0A6C0EGU6_9ZZZZ